MRGVPQYYLNIPSLKLSFKKLKYLPKNITDYLTRDPSGLNPELHYIELKVEKSKLLTFREIF